MNFADDRFFVKICGITNEEDALMSVAFGASAVGFVFAPSRRQVSPETVDDIVRRLPADIDSVGVFMDEYPLRVAEVATRCHLTAVQLHGNEGEEALSVLRDRVDIIIKAVSSESTRIAEWDSMGFDYLLVDGAVPGSGVSHDWTIFERHEFITPVIGAGGLTPGNLADVITNVPVMGVDVSTGVERTVGLKDATLVMDFISTARLAAESRYVLPPQAPFDWRV